MKNLTKLTLSALAIAVCFAACTKDNSNQTATPAVKITPKNSVSFAKKDTISPQLKTKIASPAVSRDTISPK